VIYRTAGGNVFECSLWPVVQFVTGHTRNADTEICTVAGKGLFTNRTGPKSRTQAVRLQALL